MELSPSTFFLSFILLSFSFFRFFNYRWQPCRRTLQNLIFCFKKKKQEQKKKNKKKTIKAGSGALRNSIIQDQMATKTLPSTRRDQAQQKAHAKLCVQFYVTLRSPSKIKPTGTGANFNFFSIRAHRSINGFI